MSTQVEIVNLAIAARLGMRPITAMTDPVDSAVRAGLAWGPVREGVLRDHPWGFANTLADLTLAESVTVPGWLYAYTYPTDCVAVRAVLVPGGDGKEQDYEKVNVAGTLYLASNVPNAQIRYTANVDTTALFDPAFVDAFAWRLAAELAKVLTGDDNKGRELFQQYLYAIDRAKTADANEGRVPDAVRTSNPIVDVR